MNEEKKEKRCIACKKLLINKKLPLLLESGEMGHSKPGEKGQRIVG